METSGADNSPKSSKASKKQQKKAEARRIEDNAEHERAKEALSAIAAASTRKDDEASAHKGDEASAEHEKTPVKKHRPRGASAESAVPAQDSGAVSESADEESAADAPTVEVPAASVTAAAEDGGTKRPRRRRRVAETTPVPELPIYIDLPDPVEASDKPSVPLKDASDIQLPEQHEKAPTTRRRASRKVVTASSAEPAAAPAPEVSPTLPAEARTPEASASHALVEAAAEQDAQAPAPRKTRKRRAVASSGVIEPDAAPAPLVIELPARAEAAEPAAPTHSTDDILLPEASEQPRAKRRRRVVSTGIVDAG